MAQKKTLSEQEMELVEEAAMLRAEGKTWAQLATQLNTDGERLRKLVRRSGRVYWTLFEEAQYRASMEAAAKARATLTKLLGSQDERVALRAAQTLMADDRGRKKNAVLSEKNDIFAGNTEKKRKNSESWAQLRDAEMTLAACRRGVVRPLALEPSPWQEAYNKQYGGGGGNGEDDSTTETQRHGEG